MATLKINGKDHEISFKLNAHRLYCEAKGCTLNELYKRLSSKDNFDAYIDLTYYALKEAARQQGKEFEMSIDDLYNWVGDNVDQIPAIIEIYISQQPKPKNEKK